MEVILRQDVEKVGLRGEVVDVAPGFARNYLLPRKLAETATASLAGPTERQWVTGCGHVMTVDYCREEVARFGNQPVHGAEHQA